MSDLYCEAAWLHRGTRPSWKFEPSQRYGELVHTTRRGTVYVIKSDHKSGKPFWVGRLVDDGAGEKAWVTWEDELRATSIQFEGAGEYFFYPKTEATQ